MKKITKLFLPLAFLLLALSSKAQIKVACIGNSITFGAGIEGKDSLAWPPQMAKILGNGWDVKNFGHSGATLIRNGDLPYWNLPEFQSALDFEPDVVIILLGTNDSKPQNWDAHKDEFEKDYSDMISLFKKLKSKPLIWVGYPIPVVKDTWGIRKDIVEKDITVIIRRIAITEKVNIIDFYHVLAKHDDLIPDNVHPNAEGSKLMAQEAAKILSLQMETILNRPKSQ